MRTTPARTRGELEAEISKAIIRFEREFMGRGPVGARAYLIDDVVLVRLEGALTVVETSLAERSEQGPRLVKQLRQELMACKRPLLEELMKDLLGVAVRGVYADVNTATNEGLIVMTLEARPGAGEVAERPADRGGERGLPSR